MATAQRAVGRLSATVVAGLFAAGACSRDEPKQGLPPATEWSSGSSARAQVSNPHVQMGTDVSQMGLSGPDPGRTLDPTHHVAGWIRLAETTKDRAPAGGAVFVIAKQSDAGGQPAGPPLAVQKLTWTGAELAFDLTERQAMIAGTQLTGDVIVSARYDQDGDALTKQPGDLTGTVRVAIPTERAEILLDHVLP